MMIEPDRWDPPKGYSMAVHSLNGRLFGPYQRDGVQWMLGMEGQTSGPKGGFLCDEMGLGKTVQLLATMLGNPKPRTLIIVPKSIITQWRDEIRKFAPKLSINIYDGPNREVYDTCDITIAPYTVLTFKGGGVDALTPLHHFKWDRVILDEAHKIRNRRSKLLSLCMFLGLPKNYVQGKTKEIKDIYILRRTKDDLAERLRLPPCYFKNVELDMFEEERALYECVFLEAQGIIRDAFKNAVSLNAKNMIILECLLRARQCMIWPQMYLDGMAKQNETQPEMWTGRSNKNTVNRLEGVHTQRREGQTN